MPFFLFLSLIPSFLLILPVSFQFILPIHFFGSKSQPFLPVHSAMQAPAQGHVRITNAWSVNRNIYPKFPACQAMTARLLSQNYVHVNKSALLLHQPAHSSHGREAVKNGCSVLKKKVLLHRTQLNYTLVKTMLENFYIILHELK